MQNKIFKYASKLAIEIKCWNVVVLNETVLYTSSYVAQATDILFSRNSGKERRCRVLQGDESEKPRRESFFCSPYRYVRRARETSQVSRRRHVIFTHRVCLRWLLFDVLGCPLVLRVCPVLLVFRRGSFAFRAVYTHIYIHTYIHVWCVPLNIHVNTNAVSFRTHSWTHYRFWQISTVEIKLIADHRTRIW